MKRWYQNLKKGSKETADKYLYHLKRFCEYAGVTPEELLSLEGKEIRLLLIDYLDKVEREGKSGSYQTLAISAVKSWLQFNGKGLNLKVKARGESRIAQTEKVPTREDLGKVLRVAKLGVRACMGLVAFSGLRLEIIGNYDGSDGLKLGDFPELVIENDEAYFEEELAMVIVRSGLSKARHRYFTFLCREGMDYVLDWVNYRLRKGEKVNRDSPLFPSRKGGFKLRNAVSNSIRDVIRVCGFSWRPYVLRHYFDTQLLLAEAQGIIPRDYRVFWMGHKGDIEHRYTTNKYRLPNELVEDMREKYRSASKFLETRGTVEVKRRQRVVSIDELDHFLEKGWEFVTTLPNGKVIVKR